LLYLFTFVRYLTANKVVLGASRLARAGPPRPAVPPAAHSNRSPG